MSTNAVLYKTLRADMSLNTFFILASIFFLFIFVMIGADVSIEEMRLKEEILLHRSRRQLLFPNQTLLQLNIGIGTPTPIKTINMNWAFQANFVLPWNRSQIPVDILYANSEYDGDSRKIRGADEQTPKESENKYKSDASLYHFYKYVEDLFNSFGHNGTACVLHTLCNLGAKPLHSDDDEDLLHEIASFALNPNNDVNHQESKRYIEAYNKGEENFDCDLEYEDCAMSLVDMFTILRDVN